jgi:putative ABC transport system permease protein
MRHMRRLVLRLLALVRFHRAEIELSREINAHLQLLEDDYRARGMSAGEARDAARRAFGGQVEQTKERQRDERSYRWLAGWSRDLQLGARMVIRDPGLTLIATLALTVAIGAGVGYFELIQKLFRGTLPVAGGDRIVGIYNWDSARGESNDQALHDVAVWQRALTSVEDLGAARAIDRNLMTDDGRIEPVRGAEISAAAFRMLGVPPLLGRPLIAADEQPGAPEVAVLGYELWQSRFGGDAAIIGRPIQLGRATHLVVGVMPEGFAFPTVHGLWIPLRNTGDYRAGEGPAITVFARLRDGVPLESAQAQLTAIGGTAVIDRPETHRHLRPTMQPYVTSLWSSQGDGQLQMLLLDGVNLIFLLLLGVCGANVATLVFARTVTREGEISVRSALGASRGRIVAQLFAEALVLASIAAALGLAAAQFGLEWIKAAIVGGQNVAAPFWWTDRLSPSTVLYTTGLTLVTATIVGVVPALRATGPAVQARLKHAAAGDSGLRFGGLWTSVIVTQVALTVLFLAALVAFGWNVRTGRYGTVDLAFAGNEYVSARLETDADASGLRVTLDRLKERLQSEPDVAAVTYAAQLPAMLHPWLSVEVDGGADRTVHEVRHTTVDADFFATFGQPMIAGRSLDARDAERHAAVVDRTFVRKVLGGREPIGARVREAAIERDEPGPWLEIVGVVNELTVIDDEPSRQPVMYLAGAPGASSRIHMAVHVKGDPAALMRRLRTEVAGIDPSLRLYDVMPLDRIGASEQLLVASILRVFAVAGVVALVLSTAGVYALMSFTVARRTREIGIRVALGADRRRVVTGVLARAMTQVGLGVAAGLVPGSMLVAFGAPEVANGAGATAGVAASLAIAVFMVAVGAGASAVPMRRALRVQPTEALRAE